MPRTGYLSHYKWNTNRPHVLVVACSDGRLQRAVDDFLTSRMNITDYDRLYLPGGPGALATSGLEHMRSSQQRDEFLFLVRAHEIEIVVFIFHGPAEDGPDLAMCADYMRALETTDRDLIAKTQLDDYKQILSDLESELSSLQIYGFRIEVMANCEPKFVSLD